MLPNINKIYYQHCFIIKQEPDDIEETAVAAMDNKNSAEEDELQFLTNKIVHDSLANAQKYDNGNYTNEFTVRLPV